MSTISIIGLGGMARAVGARAVKGGNEGEVVSRDAAKAEALAESAWRRGHRREIRHRPGRVTSPSSPCLAPAPCRSLLNAGTR